MRSYFGASSPFVVSSISHSDHLNMQSAFDNVVAVTQQIPSNQIPVKRCDVSPNHHPYHVLVCYTPPVKCATSVTCSTDRELFDKLIFTTDHRAATIKTNAIIDSIEFFGIDSFSTNGMFSIGLGQLNSDPTFPLIIDADAVTANERVGGCREFISCDESGKNEKSIVLIDSFVNVSFSEEVKSGRLQIVIRYHLKVV